MNRVTQIIISGAIAGAISSCGVLLGVLTSVPLDSINSFGDIHLGTWLMALVTGAISALKDWKALSTEPPASCHFILKGKDQHGSR